MKTQISIRIDTKTRKWRFGVWKYDEETDEGWHEEIQTNDDVTRLAEELQCSPVLLGLIRSNIATVVDNVVDDLSDVWKRQDALETRIKALEDRNVTDWTAQLCCR